MYYNYKKNYDKIPSLLSEGEINGIKSVLRYEATSSISIDEDISKSHNIRPLNLRVAAFVDTDTTNLDKNVIYYYLCNTNWEINFLLVRSLYLIYNFPWFIRFVMQFLILEDNLKNHGLSLNLWTF
jgi:hypothetical protein